MALKQYPAITGLTWHRHPYYSFFAPANWHRFVWTDDSPGEIYGPDPEDPITGVAVAFKDLAVPITPRDFAAVTEEFFEAVKQLPGVQIEFRDHKIMGHMLELEAKYTFSDRRQLLKCWVRIFFHETRQITMSAQGSSPEKYDYWLPIFFQAMMTARIHNEKPGFDRYSQPGTSLS